MTDEIEHVIGETDDDAIDREELLGLLSASVVEAHYQVTQDRVRDAEKDKVKQGWFRILGYLAGQTRQVQRDVDVEQLKRRLGKLKARQNEREKSRIR